MRNQNSVDHSINVPPTGDRGSNNRITVLSLHTCIIHIMCIKNSTDVNNYDVFIHFTCCNHACDYTKILYMHLSGNIIDRQAYNVLPPEAPTECSVFAHCRSKSSPMHLWSFATKIKRTIGAVFTYYNIFIT